MTEDPPPCSGCDADGDPVWCRSCRTMIRSSLVEIDRLMIWLEQQQADGYTARPVTASVAGKPGPKSPSPLIDLLDDAYSHLVSTETAWRERRGYMATRRTSLGRTTHDRMITLAFLSQQLDSIFLDRTMVRDLKKIIHWRTILQRVARAEPERRGKPGRCPRCHMVNVLFYNPATELITCRACPVVLTPDEYEDEVVGKPDAGTIPESRRALGLSE